MQVDVGGSTSKTTRVALTTSMEAQSLSKIGEGGNKKKELKKSCQRRESNPGCPSSFCWTTLDLKAIRGPYRSAQVALLRWDEITWFIKETTDGRLTPNVRWKPPSPRSFLLPPSGLISGAHT